MNLVELGELVTIKGGGTPDKQNAEYWGGQIKWATVKDFKSQTITDTVDTITELGVANSATNIIPRNTIVVPTRMAVGKVAILNDDIAINQDLKALFHNDKVDQRYLFHSLMGHAEILERQATGATVKGIKLEVLRALKIPLPPLPEQKRIAAILDQADAIRRQRQRALNRLNQLGQSIFYEMFGDPRSQERYLPLSNLVHELRYGTSNKASPSGYPTLRIPNVVGGSLNLEIIKTVAVARQDFEKLSLKAGDFLFVRTNGNPDYVGRSAIFEPELVSDLNFDKNTWIFASYLIRARLKENQIDPYFLNAFLETPYGRKQLRENSKTSAGQYNINTKGLGSLEIPACAIEAQHEYRVKLQNIFGIRETYLKKLSNSNRLFASLQQRAFRGEL